jgi:hypothetical protein
MMTALLPLMLAALPVYPGAAPKPFVKNQSTDMRTYWVEQPIKVVASWYAKRLNTKAIRQEAEGPVTYIVTLKDRTINLGASVQKLLQKGVVVWGQPGGSTYIARVDREGSRGTVQIEKGFRSLGFGPDAPVKKAKGADPNRYNGERLQGRSVEGRSVQGSFR